MAPFAVRNVKKYAKILVPIFSLLFSRHWQFFFQRREKQGAESVPNSQTHFFGSSHSSHSSEKGEKERLITCFPAQGRSRKRRIPKKMQRQRFRFYVFGDGCGGVWVCIGVEFLIRRNNLGDLKKSKRERKTKNQCGAEGKKKKKYPWDSLVRL